MEEISSVFDTHLYINLYYYEVVSYHSLIAPTDLPLLPPSAQHKLLDNFGCFFF